ncbi:response regulator transcription factor [Nonomuraea roseoviolacea subsp. roseoviolacea]|uniref:DNA-binding NarL/FixJ family response regulator n=1 Tax=Nonomuraea roseoviolacea subsp. carminata TaxID=160689 RepID=A0ABT1K4B1_9ACTN|nr:response regulator transcription factor [Nonomuraea roseoviolacea]MCP2348843.1 DNA-binding NarL/FixJ family response regulator [Nonomuraea roseoviolacea subsp. carminata]
MRLLLVDDHPIVRDGLRVALDAEPDLEVVGEASDGAEAVRLAAELTPGLVLLDLRMPGMDGVTAIRRLRALGPAAPRVLVLTTFDTDVLSALEAGAAGYLLKDAPAHELVRAVRAAVRGETVLAPAVVGRLAEQVRRPARGALSPRELEVLRLVAGGATNQQAAARLFISQASVKTHLLHVYAKLDVHDRAAAVAEAYRRGLLTP